MLDDLRGEKTATCDGSGCERTLTDEPSLVFRTAAGERRAYECACGALTITVARGSESTR